MSNLVAEILLRLLKPSVSVVLGLLLYLVATTALGETGSVGLALVCIVAAGIMVLLVQESPL